MHVEQDRFIQMTQSPLKGLILRMAVPSMASMLVTAIYNMVDTYFVGFIGTSATGAVGVVFSLMAIIMARGFFWPRFRQRHIQAWGATAGGGIPSAIHRVFLLFWGRHGDCVVGSSSWKIWPGSWGLRKPFCPMPAGICNISSSAPPLWRRP